jgi:hypothetical protein
MPDFKEVVAQSWVQPVSTGNKVHTLHVKLARLAKALKRWHKQKMVDNKKEYTEVHELVLRLDQVQDQRDLAEAEFQSRKEAKSKILGLAAVRKIRIRQRSRLMWIHVGDANTKLFHQRANTRCHRNHIPALIHEGTACITQEAKSAVLEDFFSKQLGGTTTRQHTKNWDWINPLRHDLHELDRGIEAEEIHVAVLQTALEKAPGPDGYTGAFFKAC